LRDLATICLVVRALLGEDTLIAFSNLPKVAELSLKSERVLDVGGGRHVLPYATHVIDLEPFHSDLILDPIDNSSFRFSEDTWICHDVCGDPFPFADDYFDFSFCSHLLEDVRDPLKVCKELIRVSKSGYIEVPSRQREIFSKSRLFLLKMLFGKTPDIGFPHHRWFVEIKERKISFLAKNFHFYRDSRNYIKRSELRRKMTNQESAIFIFWEGDFEYEEIFDINEAEMIEFKNKTLKKLRN
jgi:SAM-dependent methyltransferase